MASIGLVEIFFALICFVILHHISNRNWHLINWPVIGMLPEIIFNLHRPHERITELMEITGCTYMFRGPWFSDMRVLNTADPANVNYIMNTNFSNFPKGSEFLKIFDILGDGIFNSDSDLWKSQRRSSQALITHQRFYKFLVKTIHDKVTKGIVPVLDHVCKQGIVMDMQDFFQRFTFDATCMLVTGYDPGCLSTEFPKIEFAEAMDAAEEAIFHRHSWPETIWKAQRMLGLGQEHKLKKAWETLDRVVAEYISRKREERDQRLESKNEEEEGVDLLTSFMIEADAMASKSSADKFLRDTILNLMLAGRDTTSSGLSWFFWLLSENPKVWTKIREELKAIIPPNEGSNWRLFRTEEVNKVAYLHAALCESLRLYPPVPFQHKAPLQPDILPSGHRVDPKMKILFSLYSMGRMKSIWGEDCLEFKPERWISERGTVKHQPSYRFMAFNAGPRTCLGKEVAFTQMKVVAADIIHNYQIEVVKGHPVAPSASIILHMKHGLKVRVSKRWA
ncbi:alkane hydroxylase MAH1-like [Tripterygium wilfordii]|uniref:alkane hydroxylase MAH1-like n=1 Tax=Tripterygium wilfordii TaxID=458696 RepID=UPI0018F8425D|nr:alkane hydroxylase MAH1-like [Tripterygium wilfordii]